MYCFQLTKQETFNYLTSTHIAMSTGHTHRDIHVKLPTSLAKIPPILPKWGILMPYLSNSIFIVLISSSIEVSKMRVAQYIYNTIIIWDNLYEGGNISAKRPSTISLHPHNTCTWGASVLNAYYSNPVHSISIILWYPESPQKTLQNYVLSSKCLKWTNFDKSPTYSSWFLLKIGPFLTRQKISKLNT